MNNNSIFKIPSFIADRTQNYLESSCNILSWFKETFELTKNKDDIIKVKDIYELFTKSFHYDNMTKVERRKYNKSYFVEFIEKIISFLLIIAKEVKLYVHLSNVGK
jgi:hypothetical protein